MHGRRGIGRRRYTGRYGNRAGSVASNRYRYGQGSDAIKVSLIELFIKHNTQVHHTNEFDITNAGVYGVKDAALVIRRGQQFFIGVKFNRKYDATKDDIRLIFQFEKNPLQPEHSPVELSLSSKTKHDMKNWDTSIYKIEGDSVTVAVVAPPTCAVGKWTLRIDEVKSVNSKRTVLKELESPIYILFNPWSPDDQVYMKDIQFLKEYIQNESGKVYGGSEDQITHFPWNFGQFSGCVLDCVMYLLDEVSGLPDHQRGDPIHVARRISSMVNCNDDNGVLIGKWQEPYSDGTPPLAWTGSVKILEEYYSTRRPVKYGQCWVFSGVVTTVCRALGIPSRSITNFASAHDTEANLTIDKYYNSNMEEIQIPGRNRDSIWNFHVWNDVWMARPDLPSGCDGWQAIDATPQEKSGEIFCMGPMSLVALKHGHVNLQYDGRFAFAEVNGDRVMWMCYSENDKRKIRVDKSSIGKFISTKRPFTEDREDVTCQYKFREGEREAVRLASSKAPINHKPDTSTQDVEFELSADNNTFIGDPFKWMLRVKNKSAWRRTITGNVRLTAIHYWGEQFKPIGQESLPRTQLEANEDKSFYWAVPVGNYLENLTDHCFLGVAGSVRVEETDQVFGDTVKVRLRKPHLTLEAPETGYIGRLFRVRASFKNPLQMSLTNCKLRVEGPGIQRSETYEMPNSLKQTYETPMGCRIIRHLIWVYAICQGLVLKPLGMNGFIHRRKSIVIGMTPVKPGDKMIIMNFSCDQIYAITASHRMCVQ